MNWIFLDLDHCSPTSGVCCSVSLGLRCGSTLEYSLAPCKMAAIISYLLIFSQCINYPFMAFVKLICCYVIGFSLLMSAQLERALCIDYRINITYVFHLSYE